MRLLRLLALLLPLSLWADEAADRAAIRAVIARLGSGDRSAALFAAGTDVPAELARLQRANCNMPDSAGIWTEVTRPAFTQAAVQFVTADVALADLEKVQYGTLVLAIRSPIVAILKREANGWKIAALRVMAGCAAVR